MKKTLKNSFSLILFILLAGCTSKEIDLKLPTQITNKLVLYCFFNPDSIWCARVSKLGGIAKIDTSNLWVDNATVELFEDNVLIDTLKRKKYGEYISTKCLKPLFDKKYRIEVSCPGFGKIKSSNEKLPEPVTVNNIEYIDSLPQNIFPADIYNSKNENDWIFKSISFTINNKQNAKYLKLFSSKDFVRNHKLTFSLATKNKVIEYNSLNCSVLETLNTEDLFIQIPYIVDFENKLCICSITESYSIYELSLAEYDFVVNTTYLLTPNNIYSNITNGTGIMVGYTLILVDLK